MFNLVPAVGEINGLRQNYSFGMIPGEKREFGTCDMEIENKKAEPPPEVRGNVARIYFYMDAAYLGPVSSVKRIVSCLRLGIKKIQMTNGNANGQRESRAFRVMRIRL